MIQKIRTWFSNYRENRRRKVVLKDIKKAKQIFVKGELFMCPCFRRVNERKYRSYDDIHKRIPEYHPTTFGINQYFIDGAWWHSIGIS